MTRAGRLRWVAFGSSATAALVAYFAAQPVASSLVSTVGLLALVAAPGFVLMRQAPSLIGTRGLGEDLRRQDRLQRRTDSPI